MENQTKTKLEMLKNSNIKKQLLWPYAIETAKLLVNKPKKTEKDEKEQKELLSLINDLKEHTEAQLLSYKKELIFCQIMIAILSEEK